MQPLPGAGRGDSVCVGRDVSVNWKILQTTFIKGKMGCRPISSDDFTVSNGDMFWPWRLLTLFVHGYVFK